ncbi:MAG: peptidyl-tRNA hydrolase [Candidatus Bathyarchaeota archaeon]|nr:peptidyl-tRNA hydrolase Pth2 [Thermoproteota archaeon]MDT8782961.1 peptidyl-tRNA hydrolase [Candidatus Bathyarchaeota archaeon]
MSDFEYKQVLIFRTDLQMGKGKIAAQAGHAAISAAQDAFVHHKKWWEAWMYEGQKKVALKVVNEKELGELEEAADDLGLPHSLIIDRGLTQIPEGTVTCLGIGPAPAEKIDRLTGKLKLL